MLDLIFFVLLKDNNFKCQEPTFYSRIILTKELIQYPINWRGLDEMLFYKIRLHSHSGLL